MAITDIRLLCIDDDPASLADLRRAVSGVGEPFVAEFFGSAGRALAAHCTKPADIVLSDLRLGSTTGLNLIADMHNAAPGAIYMLLSGEADLQSALRALNEARIFRFLTKPVAPDDIARALHDAAVEQDRRKREVVSNSGLSAIDRLNVAIAVLDQEFRVVHANARAKEIFKENDAFAILPQGEVRLRSAAETRAFQSFLAELCDGRKSDPLKNVFRIHHPDQNAPIVVTAVYFSNGHQDDSYFSVIISDPSRKVFASSQALAVALNITPSEARIVFGLTEGVSLQDAAERAGVSMNTARTYIKNVFSKTGVTRQAELVRLALLSAA